MEYNSQSTNESDSYDWNEALINEVQKKWGPLITEEDTIKQLDACLRNGAEINYANKHGNTTLHIAVKKSYVKIVEFLIEHGAKSDIPDRKGRTALQLAQTYQNEEILNAITGQTNPSRQSQSLQTVSQRPAISSTSKGSRTPMNSTMKRRHKSDTGDNEDSMTNIKKRRLNEVETGKRQKENGAGRKSCGADENANKNKKRRSNCVEQINDEISSGGGLHPADDIGDKADRNRSYTSKFGKNNRYAASGLKETLHGNIYQLKLLMLFLKRGLDNAYSFRLATEMDAAEKFDDLVFHFMSQTDDKTVYRFLQAKHKLSETEKISVSDLFNESQGEFSLQKYFASYRKILKKSEFQKNAFQDFVVCTNIDFHFKAKQNRFLKKIDSPDVFLDFKHIKKQPSRYKFQVIGNSELYDILRRSSDAYQLARVLAKFIHKSVDLTLKNELFQRYHVPLATEIINVDKKEFFDNFVKGENLTERCETFREIFFAEAKKIFIKSPKEDITNDVLWEQIRQKNIKLSSSFGRKFEIPPEPVLISIKQFTEKLVELMTNAESDSNVIVVTVQYTRNSKIGSIERTFADNIHKLAGHVFVTATDKRVGFRSEFSHDSVKLPGNLEEFKDLLKSQLGSKYNELDRYRFKIPAFKTCTEEQLYSETELPISDVTDREIHDFFDQLIFAVNQPNEIELEDIIKKEIGNDNKFNLLQADLVGDSFQVKMLNWFKEKGKEKGKEGRFFSDQEGKELFKSLEEKVNNIVTIGLSSTYTEELKEYDIDFKKVNRILKEFLTTDSEEPVKNDLILMAAEETLLTAIRVSRAITATGKYTHYDSLIYLRLRTLLVSKPINEQVLQAFKSEKSYQLLVIDCESEGGEVWQELYDKLRETTRKYITKKVIFIINKKANKLSRKYLKNNSHVNDNVGFLDLETISQDALVKKNIINFFGQKERTSLKQLLRKNHDGERENDDSPLPQEIQMFASIIDAETLTKLICNKEIQIGNLPGFGKTTNHYIKRYLDHRVVITDEVLEPETIPDLLVISAASSKSLARLKLKRKQVHPGDFDPCKTYSEEFIYLNPRKKSEQYEILCNKTSRNIHWLNDVGGKLYWRKSKDDFKNLIKYRNVNKCPCNIDKRRYLKETKILDYAQGPRVVIISDFTGMGKTSTIDYLTKKMIHEKLPVGRKGTGPRWVMRINFNDFTTALSEELKNRSFDRTDINGAIKFFIEKLSRLNTNLEKKILTSMINNENRVVLLFDGFDEISPTFEGIVLDLLYAFKEKKPAKLFVTTKPHMRETLENELEVFSHVMVPFSKKNQIDFMTKCWQTELGSISRGSPELKRLKTYATALRKKIAESVEDVFVGVPLHTWMISVIFQDNTKNQFGNVKLETCQEFVYSDHNEPMLSAKLNMFDLYEIFVDKMYHRYYSEKKNNDSTKLGEQRDRQDARELFLKRHELLAFHTLFKDEKFDETSTSSIPVLPLLLSNKELKYIDDYLIEINKGEERTGIIIHVIDGKAWFTHRTFAEYFVANFLINALLENGNDNPQVQKFIVKHILLESTSRFKTIRLFIDGLLLNESADHKVTNFDCKLDRKEYINESGQTIFHIATKEGHFEIVNFFLKQFEKQGSETYRDLIKVQDHEHKLTVVHVAATSNHFDKVLWFMEIGGVEVDMKDNNGRTVLHHAASAGQLDLVKSLVEEKHSDISIRTSCGMTLLHCAVSSGDIPLVTWLVNEKGFNINEKYDENGESILHYAVGLGKLEVLKYMIEQNGGDIDTRDEKGRTLQHEAVKANHYGILYWLVVEKKSNINALDNAKQTVLHEAVLTGNSDMYWRLKMQYNLDIGAVNCDGLTAADLVKLEHKNFEEWFSESEDDEFDDNDAVDDTDDDDDDDDTDDDDDDDDNNDETVSADNRCVTVPINGKDVSDIDAVALGSSDDDDDADNPRITVPINGKDISDVHAVALGSSHDDDNDAFTDI